MKRGVPCRDVSCKLISKHAAIAYCSVCKLAVNLTYRSILSKFTMDFFCRSFIDSFKKSTIVSINKKRTTVVVIATARMKSV